MESSYPENARFIVSETPRDIMGIHVQKTHSIVVSPGKPAQSPVTEYEVTLWGMPDGGGTALASLMMRWGLQSDRFGESPEGQVNVRAKLKKREGVLGLLQVMQGGGYISPVQVQEIKRQFELDRQAGRGGDMGA